MRRNRILVVLCLLLAAIPACKKASETAAEKAAERAIEKATGNKADVDVSREGVKVTGKEGGKEFTYEVAGGGGAALPKNFPGDIPRYPGATVLSSMTQGSAAGMVMLQSADAPDAVYDFYVSKLRAGGWEIVGEVSTPEMHMLNGKKADVETTVTVVKDEGKSSITVVYKDGKG